MEDLARDYEGKVHFLLVYTAEAHPDRKGAPPTVGAMIPFLPQTRGYRERLDRARLFRDKVGLSRQMVVDDDDGRSVHKRYNGDSNSVFLVGEDGRVAYKATMLDVGTLARQLQALVRPGRPRPEAAQTRGRK